MRRGHNLLKLFDGLPDKTKANLETAYKAQAKRIVPESAEGFTLFVTPGKTDAQRNAPRKAAKKLSGRDDLRTLLRNEGDAFETWRYLYEAQEEGKPICYQIEFAYLLMFAEMLEKSVDDVSRTLPVASPTIFRAPRAGHSGQRRCVWGHWHEEHSRV